MRLSPERLAEITGYTRKSSQVKWFSRHFGVDVPCDRLGPIITNAAYEMLVQKRLGLTPTRPQDLPKPQLVPRKVR